MTETVEGDLVERLRALADHDMARSMLLIRWNEPTGEIDWHPVKSRETMADKFNQCADEIERLRAALSDLRERFGLLDAKLIETYAALSRAEAERDGGYALIPDNYRSNGGDEFWIAEDDPVHNTTGRSMTPEEREERNRVAHRLLGYVIAMRGVPSRLSRAVHNE